MDFHSELSQSESHSRYPRCYSAGAFTLVELMVVMSLVVVMASFINPLVGSVMIGRSLNYAIDCTWNAVSAARQQAIASHVPVALIFTVDRQPSNAERSDSFILAGAQATMAEDGSVVWKWAPVGTWRKLQHGVQLFVGADQGGAGPSFYCSSSVAASTHYDQIAVSLPALEGEKLTTYYFAIFRPDGSVDVPSNNPFLEFKRLRAGIQTNDSALVLSPDSGRIRICQYKQVL